MFGEVSGWKKEEFLDETGTIKILWNVFKISKSQNQCARARCLFCDQTSPASVPWARGRDVTVVGSSLGKIVKSSVFALLAPTSLSCGFAICETLYPQTSHQWLNVLIFYFKICSQKEHRCTSWTTSIDNQMLWQQNESSFNCRFH